MPSSSMFEPCAYELRAVSQFKNFWAEAFPPFPKPKTETFYFAFSKTKLAKILAGIPNEVLVAAKSQLTRLKGSCNIKVPTRLVPCGSSGCSRSNAVPLRRKHCIAKSLRFPANPAQNPSSSLYHREREHSFSPFAVAPLAGLPETRVTPRQQWQHCSMLAPVKWQHPHFCICSQTTATAEFQCWQLWPPALEGPGRELQPRLCREK